ncbi:unnamed protein product [Phyllotreta striolata]|uniref:Uncharacterized protein n=1 Tax=Phyllotreta striolata TaxID=444603 RepID=A0A9P0GXT1_PHYSR|nr:unnamed protein product [Phyllotreta striolata]
MNSLTLNSQNIANCCRACLSFNEVQPLCRPQIQLIYEKITDLKLNIGEKLSQNMCLKCCNMLENISQFAETCKVSDKYLKSLTEETNKDIDSDSTFSEIKSEEQNNLKIATSSALNTVNSCEISNENFIEKDTLKLHEEILMERKLFECDDCHKKFNQKSTLCRHYLTHTGKMPFGCSICCKKAKRKQQIENHIQKHHPDVSPMDYDKVVTKSDVMATDQHTNKVLLDIESTSNLKINDSESTINDLKSDDKKISSVKDENIECNTKVATEDNTAIKKKRIELCLCSLCGKQFKRLEYLRNHMATHMNVKPFSCSTCGAGFTQRQALNRHYLVHTKEKPHKCTHCDKTFARKEKLNDHIRCHEEGVPPHLCFHCGRRFKDREYLRKHLTYFLMGGKNRWKSEAKSLCPECGKEFHSVAYLKTHINVIHAGIKPYTCDICDKSFTVSAGLDYHMKIHKGLKPFQCSHSDCSKTFRTNYAKKVHERMHGTERAFKCDVCNKGFVRSSHLKRHVKLHREESGSVAVNASLSLPYGVNLDMDRSIGEKILREAIHFAFG